MAIVERALCPVLVGRDDEVTLLEDALLGACRGDGQVVVLAGDAGVGKTRLANETVERARKIGAAVLQGGCSEAELALPYLPFVEAIGNWLAEGDPAQVSARLGPAAAELAQLFPQLGASQQSSGVDPSQAKLRLFEAVLALLRVAAIEKGLLFVIEDLHWADAATRELLDYMTRRMRGARIMVLATYRLDEMHRKHPLLPIVQGWRRSRLAQVIELSPLEAEGVAGMIAAIFDYDDVSKEFRDIFHERTEGNPFVIEEMLKEAIDRGDIYRTGSRWERKGLDDLSIPRSVADSILWRVERLDPDHAEVLRYASVLGPSFLYATLVAATAMPEQLVQEALHAAVLQQLLVEEPNARYRFRHALTREAVYEDMIGPRRKEIHSRIADILQADECTPPVDLARHLLAAQRWREAVPVCLAAARSAMERRAFREAADIAARSLEHIDDELERGRVLALIGEASYGAADTGAARQHLERAVEILERHGEVKESARLSLIAGRCEWLIAHHARAAEYYERARATLERFGPSRELAIAYVRLAGLDFFNFRFPRAEAKARQAMAIAEAAGDEYIRAWATGFVGASLVYQDDVAEGFAWMDRAIDSGIRLGDVDIGGNTLHNATVMRVENGFLDEAERTVARFSELPPHPWDDFSLWFNLGSIAMYRGQMDLALDHFSAAKNALVDEKAVWHDWIEYWTSVVKAARGQFDEIEDFVRKGVHRGEAQDVELHLISLLHIAIARRDATAARAIAESSVDVPGRDGSILLLGAHALLLGGDVEGAERVIAGKIEETTTRGRMFVKAVQGLIAQARGRSVEAVELLSDVADAFEREGSVLLEWQIRPTLAEARAETGDAAGAQSELERVASTAAAGGAKAYERAAREVAARLGIDIHVEESRDEARPSLGETSERIVTVMFADVRGYTSMTRSTAPAEMHDRMTNFYRWARREIERNAGMVDKYAGDAVMASWNSTTSMLDHTELAIETAIVLQDKAALADLPVGVGIAVGSAIVGVMTGSDNVDVIGETTNLAARLQAQAANGEIALSDEAYRRAKATLERRGMTVEERIVELKGFDAPVLAFVAHRT